MSQFILQIKNNKTTQKINNFNMLLNISDKVPDIKEPSIKICVMVKENSSIKMEECIKVISVFIKVIGDLTKWMVMENFTTSLVKLLTKETGVKINSKDLVHFY